MSMYKSLLMKHYFNDVRFELIDKMTRSISNRMSRQHSTKFKQFFNLVTCADKPKNPGSTNGLMVIIIGMDIAI